MKQFAMIRTMMLVLVIAIAGWSVSVLAQIPCWESAEPVCTDGPSTRNVKGIEVTRDCWNYSHQYACGVQPIVDNCAVVRNTPGCSFSSSECLTSQPDGTCALLNYTFSCYTAGTPTTYQVCSGDIYCADGSCSPGTTDAGNNFGQAYGTFVAAQEAASSFNQTTYQMMAGLGQQCGKSVAGALDCCGSGGIINNVANCNQEEQNLATATQGRRTHYVGRYCAKKVLNTCVLYKHSFCTFDSLLARIVQENGRQQLGISWGAPQAPDCRGFTLPEFAQINFSVIDFSEFIATVTVPAPDVNAASGSVETGIATQAGVP